jgi:hypothetical protein
MWHALLAPLPAGAEPRVTPVGPAESQESPIAGWTSLALELSAGEAGLRLLQVTLDREGRPISASDHVLFRFPDESPRGPARIRQESIGGRLEPDGSFHGTVWLVEGDEPPGESEPEWEMTPRAPTSVEASLLLDLVTELMRRQVGPRAPQTDGTPEEGPG